MLIARAIVLHGDGGLGNGDRRGVAALGEVYLRCRTIEGFVFDHRLSRGVRFRFDLRVPALELSFTR